MPIFAVSLKCDLEGVGEIQPRKDNSWCLDLECGSEERKGVFLDATEENEVEGSRGTANLIIKFPGTKNAASISILLDSLKPYTAEDSGNWKVVAKFECRGCDITNFKATTDFDVISEGGHRFEKADFSEGDFSEYDEENDGSVSVLSIETKVEKSK